MIRTAQIQDIPTVVQLIHASIRSCILDHQRRESDIQKRWIRKFEQHL